MCSVSLPFRGAAFPSPHRSIRFLCLRPRATRRERAREETHPTSASRQQLRRGPGQRRLASTGLTATGAKPRSPSHLKPQRSHFG